jgi:hypothetical protein
VLKLLKNLKEKRKQAKRRRIEAKFEELYAKAEKILAKYQPCAISVVKGKVYCVDCFANRPKNIFCEPPAKPNVLCCGGCSYHSDKGCTAEKPLTCKLWLCLTAICKFPKCHKALRKLRIEANDWGFYCFRGNKQDSLKVAYVANECN